MTQKLPSLEDCKRFSETLCKTLEKIIEKIIPQPQEEKEIQQLITKEYQLIREKLIQFQSKYGFTRIELHGSAEKGTWIKDEIDLDIFIIFETPKTKQELEKLIREIASKIDIPYELLHSEHPYIRVQPPRMYPADIVPAFDLGGKKFLTATDRTIYHTRYIKTKIDKTKINEIRLLKKFFKTVGVYGAEIKTQGFSGYATELLVIKMKSMINTLEFIATKNKFILTPEDTELEPEKIYKKHKTNYILIDPVDPNRNVLAALSEETYNRAKIAAKLFLNKPSTKFFEKQKPIQEPILNKRHIYITEIHFKENTPPDVKWGILKKLTNQLQKNLGKQRIEVLYNAPLEDQNKKTYILTETTTETTPNYRKIIGPPATTKIEHIEKFLKKHKNAISGPWIEKNRLVALEKTEPQKTEKIIQETIQQLTKKYKKTITKTKTTKLTKTTNPEIIKHINRKENWLNL